MSLPACCPPSAWPALKQDASFVGKVEQIEGVDVYRTTGNCKEPASDKVIYHFYDIFGHNGGRQMVFCDTLADLFKCEVVYIDGNVIDGKKMVMDEAEFPEKVMDFLGSIPWAKMKDNYYKVMDSLEKDASRKIAMTSTCWGSLAGFKLSGAEGTAHKWANKIMCGACYHPSVQCCGFEGEDPLELGRSVQSPQIMFPCKDDPEMYDGPLIDILNGNGKGATGSETHDFRDQAHGFMTRGDVQDEVVAKRMTEAVELTYKFFTANGFN